MPSFAASPLLLPFAAFAGGLAATFCHAAPRAVGRTVGDRDAVACRHRNQCLTWALTGFLVYVANDTQLRDFTFWSMGSLAAGGWQGIAIAALPIAAALGVIVVSARALDAMLLGEREAMHLGVPVQRLKNVVMVASALAVSSAVAVSGVIGFVGIVVPHLVRMAAGPDHRIVLPGSMLAGAALLLVADMFARTVVSPAELPIGLVTSAVGSPFFLWLLARRRKFA